MKKNTKEKILKTATQRFNKLGFGKVSMYEIANELGLSRGNLAYHFKDKDKLLEAIAQKMWAELEEKREKALTFPSFKNLTDSFHKLYEIQKSYSFIFLDSHVLKHPLIKTQFRKMTTQYIQDNKTIIAFSIQLGNMKPESIPGTYHQLALNSWMISFFWLEQQIIRGDFSQEKADKAIWSLLLPYLTQKGKKALTTFVGKEFMDTIGESFGLSMDELITI